MRTTLWLDTGRPWAEILDLGRRAEAAGWDAVRVGDLPWPALECWSTAGALAGRVGRLQLQAVVDDARGRHPAVVAKLASTVDRLSGGRLLLGLAPGAGPDAQARLAEVFQVVKGLVSQPRFSYHGTFFQLRSAPLDPRPHQHPFPLLLHGGNSDLAARHADHWSLDRGAGEVAAALAQLDAACADVGRDRAEVTVSAPYPTTGVDEWVVPASALGRDRARQDRTLAAIAAEAVSPASGWPGPQSS
ncbi:MAG TPA: LLM class flavin-dependent oxidoreductase [Acidimicrobiales bacterium]|nr:LLM class flavin-dependent oxidoreductase [Acidimicrobiales bacterium]